MIIHHKKNTAFYLAVPMVDSAATTSFKTGETVADTAYYKDGAGAWTSLAITDTFAEVGSTGIYEIDLTAAEMNHDEVLIKLTAAGSADSMVIFRMFAADIDSTLAANPASGGIVAASFGAGAIDASAIAANAIGASELATDAVQEIRDSIWTDTPTESYAADGAVPSLIQAVFEIRALLCERDTASVTVTTKKVDGSTTANTYTINDAVNPTNITKSS